MKLAAAQARAIARGKKTTIRVPVDPRLIPPLRPVGRHSAKPFNPTIGDVVPLDSDRRSYCKITDLDRGPLGTLTSDQALDEGFPTVQEFEIAYVEHHDGAWLDRQVTYLLEQGMSEQDADETRDSWAKVRYDERWAPRDTWVLTVKHFDDMPYLLPGLPEEPESVAADKISKRWNVKADRRFREANEDEMRFREAKQLARRVKLMKLNNPDAPEILVIEQQLCELEARHARAA